MVFKIHVAGMVHILDDSLYVGPPDSLQYQHHLNSFLRSVLSQIYQSKQLKQANHVQGYRPRFFETRTRRPYGMVVKVSHHLHNFSVKQNIKLKVFQSSIGLLNFACKIIEMFYVDLLI